MDYFDIDGIEKYRLVAGTKYSRETFEANWYYDTRSKLEYLVKLIGEKTGKNYTIVYSEKPNGQGGRGKINFKNYVLTGFSNTKEFGDDLFMKIAFADLKEQPVFDINIDLDFRTGNSFFKNRRDEIFSKHYTSWEINESFPKNWEALVDLIIEPIKSLEEDFNVYLSELEKAKMKSKNMALETQRVNDIVKLIEYKKQIILQGPPGTGKTRLAKMIAQDIISREIPSYKISNEIIVKYMVPGLKFPSAKDRLEYEVEKVVSSGISIIASTKNSYVPLFNEIITAYNNKVWEKEGAITKGNDSYSAAIAKYIYVKQQEDSTKIENSPQFKLIQFHPSYTYEDFVRGIVAKPNPDGEGILYESENKTLGIFAVEALQNYELSKKNINISISDIEMFDLFISNIKERIAESDEQRLQLTEAVYLFEPDDKRFKYKGDNWKAHSKGLNMKFSELQKIIIAEVTERADVKQLSDLEELTKQHASYFIRVVEMFYAFKKTHSLAQLKEERKASLKSYILVIDEINRANLASVLGELIYALEYRGEAVQGMYAIDGNNKLTLPPNLYIIGTMNTADRSVGHIDYAIRRRFAFVDVLPKDLTDEPNIKFDKVLFNDVAKLFIEDYSSGTDYSKVLKIQSSKHLSEEFNAKDVWLGHSYFIDKSTEGGNIQTRLEYEIKPILLEYVKDGVLKESAIEEIEQLKTTI